MMATWNSIFSQSHSLQLTTEELYRVLLEVMQNTALIVGPILVTIMVSGVTANLIQTRGLRFSSHPLVPKFSKLNPIKGFGRIFSKNSLMELFKSLFKVAVVSIIAYQTIRGRWNEIPALVGFGVGQTLLFMGEVAMEIILKVFLVMIFLGILDYAFQRFTYMEELRMTKQEVKDERKETEGNPQIKQRIRTVQVEMMKRRMMSAVPEA
ncbi:MAG: flagellar biosynthesis protein FlhB, partial [Nitrospinaceae bacterium]|nr:EscU/YscU/HrcU family type III secretion system export apparatus switch protein [Nitrospinaceae bacterium]NIR56885.1 EscU/YscU/HrcU family type III secretion system export apparatus switch protein [Nitrospinaceae bacterium]NIS87347.1 EscU/YscU/HrcU family type III secretion system export apparatus switch protein [Nitrospinaceae bacterium]NIT84202.1 EscU/YscU/HrcU family type III secretion system export apparatus switch protein [Nitrospinaceae bacterium]NIU46387.1 EscU/YscU/HrcU family type I